MGRSGKRGTCGGRCPRVASERLRYHGVVRRRIPATRDPRSIVCRVARLLPGIALGVVLGASASCEIVDPGPEVGVANRCVLAPSFFIERIVPEYLDAHGCADEAGCHRAADANSIFRLQDTSGVLMPLPEEPLSAWPTEWQENFRVTGAQISDCDVAELAPLYSEPAGGNTLDHGGGDLFGPDGPELELIQAWLANGG